MRSVCYSMFDWIKESDADVAYKGHTSYLYSTGWSKRTCQDEFAESYMHNVSFITMYMYICSRLYA